MKYKTLIFISLFTLQANAENFNLENKNKIETVKKTYPSNELITKLFKKSADMSDRNIYILNTMLLSIDEEKYFSDYKKYLIKNLSMLNYKASIMHENDKELTQIAKYIFPLSICAAYQFKDDLMRVLQGTSSYYITSQKEKSNYIDAFQKMNKLYLQEKQDNFNPEASFFEKNCIN